MKKLLLWLLLIFITIPLTSPVELSTINVNDFCCLVWVVSDESRGEPLIGARAVYDVVQARMKLQNLSACEIIAQPKQFSGYHKGMKLRWDNNDLTRYKEAVKMEPVVPDATHFHAVYVKPVWRLKLERIMQINNHIFYKQKEKSNHDN